MVNILRRRQKGPYQQLSILNDNSLCTFYHEKWSHELHPKQLSSIRYTLIAITNVCNRL